MNKYIIIFCFLILPFSVQAEYCATGKIEGNICSGFIIESCKFLRVDAIKNDKGELFSVNKCYPKVSEYKESKNLCWIYIKSIGGNEKNILIQPKFLHKSKSGEYEDMDVEYLVFKCTKK